MSIGTVFFYYSGINCYKTRDIFASLPVFWDVVGNKMTSNPGQSQITQANK